MKLTRLSLLVIAMLMSTLVGSQAFGGGHHHHGGKMRALPQGTKASQDCPYYVTCYNGLLTRFCCYGSADTCLAFCEGACDGPCDYYGN
jgi:hypothetical protein